MVDAIDARTVVQVESLSVQPNGQVEVRGWITDPRGRRLHVSLTGRLDKEDNDDG